MNKEKLFYIDQVINNEFTKVKIQLNIGGTGVAGFLSRFAEVFGIGSGGIANSVTVEGFLIDDTIPLDSSANWADLNDDSISEFIGGGSLKDKLARVAGAATGVSGRLVAFTQGFWTETEKPQFDIGLLFLNTDTNNALSRPEAKASLLSSCCYPNFLGPLMESPMGYIPANAMLEQLTEYQYQPGQSSSITGTCNLSIGKWLHVPSLLLKNASFEYSKECAPNGSPLYASGKVLFETSRIVSANEYAQWFIAK